jgi:3-oxoacyl-[acyl-carrier protein] reductase
MQFEDKVAVITGGAIGFGRAFGRALAAEGASIAVLDVDAPAAKIEAEALGASGHRAVAVECDVADEQQVDAAIATVVAELGGVDLLVNNAGKHLTKYNQPFSVLPRHEVRAVFEVNVMGVVNCTVACREPMRARGGGAIVNISSIAGRVGSSSPYAVSKLAVRGLTVAFARELAEDGIRVNAIAPGLMATENALADLDSAFVDHFVNELQLVKRLGTMDDIVDALVFLCGDRSTFITGETLQVSGGYPLSL